MSNDANALKRKEQIKKWLIYAGMGLLFLASLWFIFKPSKEMAANLGQNLGTSISITNQSAGDQLLSELGKGVIQGVSQYISKKMREEKVHLKSGYTLMLYQNNIH